MSLRTPHDEASCSPEGVSSKHHHIQDHLLVISKSRCTRLKFLTLKLDFVLNNQRLALWINGLVEFGRDGMMGSLVLDDETLVPFHALEDSWLFYSPVANVGPFFLSALLLLLLCM
jgi:hypothetical protein